MSWCRVACAQAQHAGDFVRQRDPVDRLRGETVHADLEAGAAVLGQHAGRHRDHGNARASACLFLFADPARGREAVEHRHLEVHQDQVEFLARGHLDHGGAVRYRGERVAAARQQQLQQLQVLRHVVGRQHAQRRQGGGGAHARLLRRKARHHQRQHHVEGRAFSDDALGPDLPAHQFDQLLADRGPEAGAAETARHRGVGLGERVEDRLQALRGDADAGVLHGKVQHAVLLFGAQANGAGVVNLIALSSRLVRTWRMRSSSPRKLVGRAGS
jgi:hypothetical protein